MIRMPKEPLRVSKGHWKISKSRQTRRFSGFSLGFVQEGIDHPIGSNNPSASSNYKLCLGDQRQADLAQIQLVFDLTEHFVVQAPFIPQTHCGMPFDADQFLKQLFVSRKMR